MDARYVEAEVNVYHVSGPFSGVNTNGRTTSKVGEKGQESP